MPHKVIVILILFVAGFAVFSASGWLAQQIFMSTGCVWTSSAGFGASFVGILSTLVGAVLSIMDWTDWN
jgi:hypothetical protein